MFETLTGRLNQIFDSLRRRGKLSAADVDAAMRAVRLALLEADVHYSVVKHLVARLRERAVGAFRFVAGGRAAIQSERGDHQLDDYPGTAESGYT